MTPEEFQQLVKEGDREKLTVALSPLTEDQRKKLAKTAADLYKVARQNERIPMMLIAAAMGQDKDRHTVTALAVLGVCGWTEAKKVRSTRFNFLPLGRAERILRDRKPDWLDKWVEQELESERCEWPAIRGFVRDGLCARPTSDRYIFHMLRNPIGWYGPNQKLITTALREDRGLLETEVWRIFEADFGDEAVLRPGEFEHNYRQGWGPALVELAVQGEIDRSRLLSATLKAMKRKQHPSNASWFFKVHEALNPAAEERFQRQQEYAELLMDDVPAVVKFACDSLTEIGKSQPLNVQKIAPGLGTALATRQKGSAMAAANLLKLCAKQKDERVAIATAAAVGLEHPAVEVQQVCVGILEVVGISGAEEAVAARAQGVSASLRPRVEALLGETHSAPVAEESQGEDESALVNEAAALPEKWRTLAGIDPTLSVLQTGGELSAVAFGPLDVPRLDTASVVEPIRTIDELIERLSRAVENLQSSLELDLILDGICRLQDRPADFSQRTAPLLQRATAIVGENPAMQAFVIDPQMKIAGLARAWIAQEDLLSPKEGTTVFARIFASLKAEPAARHTISTFLMARMSEAINSVRGGIVGPLLSLPTHAGGWIDPRELVRRVIERKCDLPHMDLIQAMLRLAPEHRAEALRSASAMSGESGAALRFALGGDEAIGKDAALWIAAARARSPQHDFEELARAFGSNLGPDAALPATYKFEVLKGENRWETESRIHFETDPPLPNENIRVDRPTVLRHKHDVGFWAISSVAAIICEAAVWPANQEAFFAQGAMNMAARLKNPASTMSPTAPYLEPLFDPDTVPGPMGLLAVCMAILSKDAGARGLAVDAMISLIADGRCVGAELGSALAGLHAASDIVLLNRVAESLGQIARAGPLAQHVAANVVQSFLVALHACGAEPPKDLHHLLTPLHEWLTALRSGPGETTRAFLQSVKVGGKTKALVTALLAMPMGKGTPRAVAIEALRGRVERARRWAVR
jgi:hypothetical protein